MNFKKLLAIVKISRPSNVIIAGLTIFAGVLIFGKEKFDIFKLAFIAGVAGALIDAGGNIINDFFDVEIDKVNKPHRPIPAGLISKKFALVLYFLTTFGGLIISLLLNKISFAIAFISVIVIFLYSFRLKRIPLIGNLTVAFMTGLAFIFAGSVVNNFKDSPFPFVFAFMVNLGREIIKDIEDIEGDLKVGIKTLPAVVGEKFSAVIACVILGALIPITLVPYFIGIYNYLFILIITAVDVGIVYVIVSLVRNIERENLNRLSNILKFEMLIGLSAIYFGSLR